MFTPQVYVPTPCDFLPRLCLAALRPSPDFLSSCHYLLDGHLPLASHPATPPSLLAAAAVFSTKLLLNVAANPGEEVPELEDLWTSTLQYYSAYLGAEVRF